MVVFAAGGGEDIDRLRAVEFPRGAEAKPFIQPHRPDILRLHGEVDFHGPVHSVHLLQNQREGLGPQPPALAVHVDHIPAQQGDAPPLLPPPEEGEAHRLAVGADQAAGPGGIIGRLEQGKGVAGHPLLVQGVEAGLIGGEQGGLLPVIRPDGGQGQVVAPPELSPQPLVFLPEIGVGLGHALRPRDGDGLFAPGRGDGGHHGDAVVIEAVHLYAACQNVLSPDGEGIRPLGHIPAQGVEHRRDGGQPVALLQAQPALYANL